ncbi:hypothetical protein [Treponema sp. J25]|nr:hypothetical protein [Treponema sp. J25]
MIRRILVDTDLLLDVAFARVPFVEASKLVLASWKITKPLVL